ncbi:MAG: hypothetical protein ACMG6S_08885 [Byssovorax sp.]
MMRRRSQKPRSRPVRLSSALALSALAATALRAVSLAAAGSAAPGAVSAIELTKSACFDRAQLGAEVDRYLDQPLGPTVSVTVRDDTNRLVIESASGAVEKDVAGWSCKQRLDYAAVSISIILGGSYTPHEATTGDSGPPDAAAPVDAGLVPPILPPPPVRQTPGLPAPRSPVLEISAQGGGAFELLPRPAAGLLLSADRNLIGPLDLHASLLITSSVEVPFRLADARVSLIAGVIDACLARGEALRLRLCAGLAVGRLAVAWEGLSPATTPSAWSAAAGRVDARFTLSRQISLVASVDMFFPFGQQRIEVVQPGVCPDRVPTTLAPVCTALTPFSGGQVVEASALSGAGILLSAGPVLTFW